MEAETTDARPFLEDILPLTAELLHLTLQCDTLAVALCVDGQHRLAVFGNDGREDAAALAAETAAAFVRLAGSHSRCASGPLVHRPLAATTGTAAPAARVYEDAPLVVGGEVCGLTRAGWTSALPEDRRRLFFAAAQQLSVTLERAWEGRGAPSPLGGQAEHWIDGLRDGVLVVDSDMRVLALNEAATSRLAGLGVTVARGVRLQSLPLATAALEALAAGQAQPPLEMPGESESPLYLSLTATPLLGADRVVLVLRDVTEERLMQERLLQSEKMATVGQLVSGVAHELNNPLTGVMGFAQLLLMRDLDDRTRREVETIYGEAERASKIVQNLLTFARRRRAQKEMVNINNLVQRVLELRNYELAVHDIEVATDLDPHLPDTMADPGQVQQVLLNIVINAEQAILAEGSGGHLAVTTRAREGAIRLTFKDDGPGIAPENLRRIFDPFFTTKQAGEGTGLGLTISYGIMEEHGGRIIAESRLGQGATFTVELPVVDQATGALAELPPAPAPRDASVRNILVVDDEESIRNLLRGILGLDGHVVEVATNGAEALERVGRRQYDVVITDIKMPVMDGQALYRRLKEIDRDLARRVIFITGDTVNAETRNFLHRISNPCLPKPFRVRDVREMVERALGR